MKLKLNRFNQREFSETFPVVYRPGYQTNNSNFPSFMTEVHGEQLVGRQVFQVEYSITF